MKKFLLHLAEGIFTVEHHNLTTSQLSRLYSFLAVNTLEEENVYATDKSLVHLIPIIRGMRKFPKQSKSIGYLEIKTAAGEPIKLNKLLFKIIAADGVLFVRTPEHNGPSSWNLFSVVVNSEETGELFTPDRIAEIENNINIICGEGVVFQRVYSDNVKRGNDLPPASRFGSSLKLTPLSIFQKMAKTGMSFKDTLTMFALELGLDVIVRNNVNLMDHAGKVTRINFEESLKVGISNELDTVLAGDYTFFLNKETKEITGIGLSSTDQKFSFEKVYVVLN